MQDYALVRKTPEGQTIVATVKAGTQGQAVRKLYRAKRIDATDARNLGYSVEFYKPVKNVAAS